MKTAVCWDIYVALLLGIVYVAVLLGTKTCMYLLLTTYRCSRMKKVAVCPSEMLACSVKSRNTDCPQSLASDGHYECFCPIKYVYSTSICVFLLYVTAGGAFGFLCHALLRFPCTSLHKPVLQNFFM
jgi:hypothetical protein